MSHLREVIGHVQEEAEFNRHVADFMENAARSNLAGEPQPTSADVAKIMKEFDAVSLGENQS